VTTVMCSFTAIK